MCTHYYIIFLLFVIIVVLLFLVIFRKPLQCSCFNMQDSSDLWSIDTTFNKNNYTQCCNIISYIYNIVNKKQKITSNDIQSYLASDLKIDNAVLILGTDNYFTESIYDTQIEPTYNLIGIVGQLSEPGKTNIGVIAFRGTQSDQNWTSNLVSNVVQQLDISKPTDIDPTMPGKYVTLPDVPPTKFKPDTKVGKGWYELYTRVQGAKTVTGCICAGPCNVRLENNFMNADNCIIIDPDLVSTIDNNGTCKPQIAVRDLIGIKGECDGCINHNAASPAIAQIVLDAVKALQVKGVTSFIITGHSLGGALATICSYHLAKAGIDIHSIYTFASPKTGNDVFVNDYNTIIPESKVFRVYNSKDIVTSVPIFFTHVANDKYNIKCTNDQCKDWSVGDYHSLVKDYKNIGIDYFFH